jgi:hypothetical protein
VGTPHATYHICGERISGGVCLQRLIKGKLLSAWIIRVKMKGLKVSEKTMNTQAFKFGFLVHFGGRCIQGQPNSRTRIQAYKVVQGIVPQCCLSCHNQASFRLRGKEYRQS